MRHIAAACTLTLLPAIAPAILTAQSALERTQGLPAVWTGIPWSLEVGLGSLVGRTPDGTATGSTADPSVRAELVLPGRLVAGARFAPQPAETGGRDEVEAALRASLLEQGRGHAIDLTLGGRIATGSEMATVGATAARWLGPLRVAGTAGAIAGDERVRAIAGTGALWHPAPGRLPIAVAADVTRPLRLSDGESAAWTAGLQLGVSYTPHTLSVFATNGGTALPGQTSGTDRIRVGVELTSHIPVGRFLGRYVERDAARTAVRTDTAAVPVVVIPIREYRYTRARVDIPVGTAVEWINYDAMVHTATADNGAWNSGGLQQGESWRAVFTEPGVYPYHCGPHPYMRGVIVVR